MIVSDWTMFPSVRIVEDSAHRWLLSGGGRPVGRLVDLDERWAICDAGRMAGEFLEAGVDFEPVAVAHATEILSQLDTTVVTVTRADARDPASVLAAPGVAGLLDFDRPIAVLAVSLFHFVEGDIGELLARYRAALATGSVVAVSHVSDDQPDEAFGAAMRSVRMSYASSATPLVLRSRAQLREAMGGLQAVGLVP